jgi:hypothetical protein
MKAPHSDVYSAHDHCAECLALYPLACSLDNGIRWPWLCTLRIWAAHYHNALFLLRKKYKIEID